MLLAVVPQSVCRAPELQVFIGSAHRLIGAPAGGQVVIPCQVSPRAGGEGPKKACPESPVRDTKTARVGCPLGMALCRPMGGSLQAARQVDSRSRAAPARAHSSGARLAARRAMGEGSCRGGWAGGSRDAAALRRWTRTGFRQVAFRPPRTAIRAAAPVARRAAPPWTALFRLPFPAAARARPAVRNSSPRSASPRR